MSAKTPTDDPSNEYPEGSDHARLADELRSGFRTGLKARWIRALSRPAKALGLDVELMFEQLERQNHRCPICTLDFEIPHIDLDADRRPRGILCGWCCRYLKAIEGDPLRAPRSITKEVQAKRARVLVYLGYVTPAS